MTLEENEKQIYNELLKNRCKLYYILSHKINEDTNNYFFLDKNTITYEPIMDSSLEVIKMSSNSNAFVDQGDGVVSLKGAVLKEGWYNCGLWEMSVDISFDKLMYTGIILLTDADNPFPYRSTYDGWGIKNWEGSVTGTPRLWDGTTTITGNYTKTPNTTLSDGNYNTKNVAWYTLHMKKTSPTTLEVWKNDNINNKVIYEWQELSDVVKVTFGANTNPSGPAGHGSMFIRNFSVTYETPTNSLTELCEKTKKIKCNINNSATVPPQPTLVSGNTLAINEFNIHNKTQYCNNVLRYTLRKCGIDFIDEETGELSNKMHELIRFINEILITSTIDIDDIYSAYVNPIQLSGDKSIVQANETYNLIAEIVDKGAGINVDFIQKNKQLFTNSCKSGVTDVDQFVPQSDSSITRESDGSVFATTGSATGFTWANKTGTSTTTSIGDYYGDCVVECDCISTSNNSQNGIIFYETYRTGAVSKRINLAVGHNKIVKKGNTFTYYNPNVPNGATVTMAIPEPYRIGIRLQSNGGNIKLANFSIVGDEPVYPITDTLFSDTGVTGDTNPNWYDNNYGTVSVGSDGTLLTSTNTTNFLMHNASNDSHTSSDQYIWNAPFVVEFDVVSMSGTGTDTQFQVYSDETTKNWATGLTGVGHYKAIVLEGNQRLYKDGELQTNFQSYSLPNCRITLRVKNSATLKYKNFKVYEIAENSITDVNGIATCGLLGNGNGLETYSAKYGNIESGAVDIIDGVFKDIGTNSNYAAWTYINNTTLSRSTSETTMTQISSSSAASQYVSLPITDEFCIEFDLSLSDNSVSSYSVFSFRQGTSSKGNIPYTRLDLIDNRFSHIKMIISGNTVNLIVDGESKPDLTLTDTINRFYIGVNYGASLKYKNFVIYPIENE